MKKLSMIALVLVLTMSLAACRRNKPAATTTPATKATTATTQATTQPTSQPIQPDTGTANTNATENTNGMDSTATGGGTGTEGTGGTEGGMEGRARGRAGNY